MHVKASQQSASIVQGEPASPQVESYPESAAAFNDALNVKTAGATYKARRPLFLRKSRRDVSKLLGA